MISESEALDKIIPLFRKQFDRLKQKLPFVHMVAEWKRDEKGVLTMTAVFNGNMLTSVTQMEKATVIAACASSVQTNYVFDVIMLGLRTLKHSALHGDIHQDDKAWVSTAIENTVNRIEANDVNLDMKTIIDPEDDYAIVVRAIDSKPSAVIQYDPFERSFS